MRVHIREIGVSNFKNLLGCRLVLNQSNVLVGENNAGKSNFFEVFSVLHQIFFGEAKKHGTRFSWYEPPAPESPPTAFTIKYDVIDEPKTFEVEYRISFWLNPEFSLTKKNALIKEEVLLYKEQSTTGAAKRLFERADQSLKLRNIGPGKASFRTYPIAHDVPVLSLLRSLFADEVPKEFELFLTPLAQIVSARWFRVHNSYVSSQEREVLRELHPLMEKKDPRWERFVGSLKDVLGLQDLQIKPFKVPTAEDATMYFGSVRERPDGPLVMLDSLSDGSQILFIMLFELFVADKPLVLIDEPEIGLHPKAIKELLDIIQFQLLDKQVIMATHSPYIVNLVGPKSVTIVERDEKGMATFRKAESIENLEKRLKSKYVNFGDIFVDNFRTNVDTTV